MLVMLSAGCVVQKLSLGVQSRPHRRTPRVAFCASLFSICCLEHLKGPLGSPPVATRLWSIKILAMNASGLKLVSECLQPHRSQWYAAAGSGPAAGSHTHLQLCLDIVAALFVLVRLDHQLTHVVIADLVVFKGLELNMRRFKLDFCAEIDLQHTHTELAAHAH